MTTPSPSEFTWDFNTWLHSHSEHTLTEFFWRTTTTTWSLRSTAACAPDPTDSIDALENSPLHHHGPVSGLATLSSLELAILHALSELDATSGATWPELLDTLTELFDIAGTPTSRRPTPEAIHAAVGRLATHGLVFGPELTLDGWGADAAPASPTHPSPDATAAPVLGIMPALASHFTPTTTEPWRLADLHRCPLPTDTLPAELDALPTRTRHLITTLHHAGGIGRSATLQPDADPSLPLPTLVRAGILDQLDDTTARLSGRIAIALTDTIPSPPGGVPALPPETTPTETTPTDLPEPSVADIILRLDDLRTVLQALATTPISPLKAGGIGRRDLQRLARDLTLSEERVTSLILLAAQGELIDAGPTTPRVSSTDATWWALTRRGADLLHAPIPHLWAALLTGWLHSSIGTPDLGSDPLLTPTDCVELYRGILRRHLPTLLIDAASVRAAGWTDEPLDALRWALWHRLPAIAWHTADAELAPLLSDAADLGLSTADGHPTTLARHLADHAELDPTTDPDPLAEHLTALLPPPTDILIVQGDLTILAPGLLRPADARLLSAFSEQESVGIASVWRMSEATLTAGARTGLLPDFRALLEQRHPGGSAALPQSLRYLLDAASASTPADGAVDSPESAGTGPASARMITVDTPTRGDAGDHADTIAGLIEQLRRSQAQRREDEAMVHGTEEMKELLQQAYRTGATVRIHEVNDEGHVRARRVVIMHMRGAQISAIDDDDGSRVGLQLPRLAGVGWTHS